MFSRWTPLSGRRATSTRAWPCSPSRTGSSRPWTTAERQPTVTTSGLSCSAPRFVHVCYVCVRMFRAWRWPRFTGPVRYHMWYDGRRPWRVLVAGRLNVCVFWVFCMRRASGVLTGWRPINRCGPQRARAKHTQNASNDVPSVRGSAEQSHSTTVCVCCTRALVGETRSPKKCRSRVRT